jgi:hypothetical protein
MNRREDGALGDPVLAGNPVYDLDGRRCSQISFKGHLAAVLGPAHGLVTSSKGVSQTGWAHSTDARPETRRVKLSGF